MDQRKIESSLLKKGFVRKQGDHRYYHHKFEGKFTGVNTKFSLGSKHKRIDNSLLAKIKRQLKLDTLDELRDLVDCPMSKEQYLEKLMEKGLVPRND